MKTIILPCLALLMLAALPASAQEGAPTIAWKFQTEGEIWGAPTVDSGVVYVGSDDGRLYAVDAQTGTEIWHFQTGDKVRSRPALTETLVYAACDDGYLYAIKREDGTEVWRGDIGTAFVAMQIEIKAHERTQWDYQQSSPTVADGMVYVGGVNKFLFAFDAGTGEERWRFQLENTIGRVWASPTVADGMVYIGGDWGTFHAIDAQTGEAVWSADLNLTVRPSATVADGMVFIGSRNPALIAFDANTGAEIWSFSYGVSWVESTAAVVDGVLYIGSSDLKRLNAINAATGEEIWHYGTPGYPWSSPAVSNGVVYIGDIVGSAGPHFFAVNADSGEEIWRMETGEALDYNYNGVASSSVVVDGRVYFGSLDGNLYAVEAE